MVTRHYSLGLGVQYRGNGLENWHLQKKKLFKVPQRWAAFFMYASIVCDTLLLVA